MPVSFLAKKVNLMQIFLLERLRRIRRLMKKLVKLISIICSMFYNIAKTKSIAVVHNKCIILGSTVSTLLNAKKKQIPCVTIVLEMSRSQISNSCILLFSFIFSENESYVRKIFSNIWHNKSLISEISHYFTMRLLNLVTIFVAKIYGG